MVVTTRTKVLVAMAAAVLAYVVFDQGDSTTPEPVGPSGAATGVASPGATGVVSQDANRAATSAAVRARTQHSRQATAGHLLELLQQRVANSNGSDALFAVHSWYVAQPTPPPPPPEPAVSVAPPAPTAPPLPFKYIGSYTADGGTPIFFLTQGDRVYDVRLGDTLASLYSVDGFDGTQLLLTYKPLEIQQQLAVTANQATIAVTANQTTSAAGGTQ